MERGEHADGGEGDREHDHQRIEQALELARHDHVDHDQRQQQADPQLPEGLLLFLEVPAHLEDHALRQRDLCQRRLNLGHGAGHVASRDLAGDGYHPFLVEALDRHGSAAFLQTDQVLERQHPARAVGDALIQQPVQVGAVVAAETNAHVVFVAALPIERRPDAAQARLQAAGDGLHRYAEARRPLPVHVNAHFGLSGLPADADAVNPVNPVHGVLRLARDPL